MSNNGTLNGYAGYKVADNVNYHEASMLGLYDVFINTQGAKIAVANSMEIPDSKGVKVHHACNVRISTDNMGGFQTVINGQTQSTYYATGAGKRFYVVDYSGTKEPAAWQRPENSAGVNTNKDESAVLIYPNPFKNIFVIDLKNDREIYNIQIHDITGRIIYQNTGLFGLTTVNLQNSKSGIYNISISNKNGIKTYKIVKN